MAPCSSPLCLKAPSAGYRILTVFCGMLFVYICMVFQTQSFMTFVNSRNTGIHFNQSHAPDFTTRQNYIDIVNFPANCEPREMQKVSKYRLSEGNSSGYLVRTLKRTSCPRDLREASSSFPRTWLLSLPGSGNTWLRHILQQLTGLPTGSVYHDGILQKNGFPYEKRTDHVVAIKIHSFQHIMTRAKLAINTKKDRLILLVRNPYRSFLAEYKRGRMKLKHIGNDFVNNNDESWRKYIDSMVPKWGRNMLENLKSELEKIIVFYEDLQVQLLEELIRLAAFLEHESLKEFSFCCTLYESEGQHHRPPSNQTVEDVYTKENKRLMNSMLSQLVNEIQYDYPKTAKKFLTFIIPNK